MLKKEEPLWVPLSYIASFRRAAGALVAGDDPLVPGRGVYDPALLGHGVVVDGSVGYVEHSVAGAEAVMDNVVVVSIAVQAVEL